MKEEEEQKDAEEKWEECEKDVGNKKSVKPIKTKVFTT